jgi:predicted DNA-binding antitoxin AbrB/MazE fold protein
MTIDVDAVYENGTLKLDHPVSLAEKARVHVRIETVAESGAEDDPTGWKTARELIGCIPEDLSADDVALNPDRHIYRRDP